MKKDKKEVIVFGFEFFGLHLLPLAAYILVLFYYFIDRKNLYFETHDTIGSFLLIFLFSASLLLQVNFLVYMGVWLVEKCKNPYLKKLVTNWQPPIILIIIFLFIDLIIHFKLSELPQLCYDLIFSLTKNFLILYFSALVTKNLTEVAK